MGRNWLRGASNEQLAQTLAKLRKERAHPEIYGRHGTTRWVTEHEFFGKKGISAVKAEVKRRQESGKMSKRVGKPIRHSNSVRAFGFNIRL